MPKTPNLEEANDRGLIKREDSNGGCVIKVTTSGLALLAQARP
jgi:CTP-dependent riboflavin kinase